MKLLFPERVIYNGDVFAEKGEIKEVTEEFGFAARWIKRGAVEVVTEVVPAKVEVEESIEDILGGAEEVLEVKIEKQLEEKLGEDLDVEVKIEKAKKPKQNKGN